MSKTLSELQGVPASQRTARFASAAALVSPDGRSWTFAGEVPGHIPDAPRGEPRPKLPYDTISIPEGHDRTYAEMTEAEKNSLSHRGLAFAKLKKFILEFCRTPE